MAKDIPTYEPRSFVAGSTISWTRSLADYPASDWTLKYFLRGPGDPLNITCTADGDDHAATISATLSKLAPGEYWLQGRVENAGGEKFVVYEQRLFVRAGLDSINTFDGKTEAEQVLEGLVALAKKKASMLQAEYTIAGRQMKFETQADLIKAISYWSRVVSEERRLRRVNEGGDFFQNVNVRF